ncbi:MAG: Hpt domain-containing protein [Geminicoccaceae bacterium]|nr:Hpt domain-containing protein [Geminicoccaceae bacterium]
MTQQSAARAGPEDLPVVDVDHLQGFTDGDRALERELAELYLSSADLYLQRLQEALGDADGWRRHAHALKGASANLGAREVAAMAANAEHGSPEADVLRRLAAAVDRVRAFFVSRSGRQSGR